MNECAFNLNVELTFQGLEEFLLLDGKTQQIQGTGHEQQREPVGDKKDLFAQSEAPFMITKLQSCCCCC
jgi:hypothetical protein